MFKRALTIKQKKSFFLFGPRGTGKTSWIHSHFPSGLYIDLLQSDLYTSLSAQPQRVEAMIPPGFDDWIMIDEIQRVPELLNEVHRLIEKAGYRFVLTGSSARSLRKKGVNLLGGRAHTYHLHPLTASELKSAFNLERSLDFGHLPTVFVDDDPDKYLNSYVRTYITEEVLFGGMTRNLGAFNRFLQTASFSQGAVLNVSEIAREAGIHRKVVESYFQILEDLLLAKRIPVFTKRAQRSVVAHPKFYFFDAGVFRAIRPMGPLDSPEEAQGAAMETLVYQELAAAIDYYELEYELFYWRTPSGLEIDFILYGNQGLVAIEVKRSQHVSKKDLNALREFSKDYPLAKTYLFYGGSRRQYEEGITIIPVAEALKELPSLLSSISS